MSVIEYKTKPDTISYDELYELLYNAHAENRKRGMIINPDIKSGEDLKAHLGKDHVCMVAMDGNQVVGTFSIRIEKGTRKISKNLLTGYLSNMGVSEEYRGMGVGAGLISKLAEYAEKEGADALALHVREGNNAYYLYKKAGFIEADYLVRDKQKRKTIYMIKWLGRPKYPKWSLMLHYGLKKAYLTAKYRC